MPLRVYNTLTRQKEDFQTVEPGKVKMYLCGPTVYKPAHIGHMVGPVIFDTVKRYLAYLGYKVTFVVNITDVDDKLINKATEKKTTVQALAQQMTQDYFDNLQSMGVDSIDQFPKATEHISDMLDMIQTLIDKKHAYPQGGDVYFDTASDHDYGKLSHRSIEQMLAGTRVETNETKRHPADFALWKKSKPGEPSWDSPWGPGRPGWHIECSAMSRKILGPQIDIHGGGLDLMFPHHENELAQSESCNGCTFVRYWLHNGLMQASSGSKVGGAHDRRGDQDAQIAGKLAGSAGAESIKTAVFAHHPPEIVRFFLLATHYRSPIDFSLENIAATEKSMDGFYRLFESFQRITGQDFYSISPSDRRSATIPLPAQPADLFGELKSLRDRFLECMDDDFNTGGAVGVLFELRKRINAFINDAKLESAPTPDSVSALKTALTLFKELAAVLGVFRKPLPKQSGADDSLVAGLMQLILDLRASARTNKDWPTADRIRNSLKALNVVVEDRPDGVRWSRG